MMNSIASQHPFVTPPPWSHKGSPVAIRGQQEWESDAMRALSSSQSLVSFRAPIPIKLPGGTYFFDHPQIQLSDQNLVLVAAGLSDDLATRVAEVALSIKLPDI